MSEKYEFVVMMLTALNTYVYPVRLMCEWLSVSRSGFYDWRSRSTSAAASRHAELRLLVRHVFEDSDQTYGYRRVHAELGRCGVVVGAELVRHLMREQDLVPCQPRPFRVSLTSQDANQAAIPDLGGMGVRGHGHRLLFQEGHRLHDGRQLQDAPDQRRHSTGRTE